MYLDRRLWAFTRGVRLRIVGTVVIGLLAVAAGIARLALFGWLLGRVIAGESLRALLPLVAVTAAAVLVRGALDYWRAMAAHHTAARVQAALRQAIYDRVTALGPAHFTRSRTGDVILSMVEGVQQLEVYFGQYLPQLAVAALTPVMIFAFVAFVDLPVALVLLVAALVTLVAPAFWHRKDSSHSLVRQKAYAAGGILQILEAQPKVRDRETPLLDASTLAPSVTFEGVSFSYPGGRQPAHDGLSFEVKAGERTGIVGTSGAGKSTVARLLLRFYDPERGRVLIGGHDIHDLTLDQLRGLIAVVSQDTYLFHGTVEQNLRMGKPDATPAQLQAAARAANAEEFIVRLPQGYDTVVGERGVRLSGGQRQRIAIARALLRDAPILILDEALSAVDAESEAVIQEALDRLMEGRTTLIFAHRLSSVIGADRILVLEGGRVVERGSHAELMARGGAYHRLMAAQAQDGAGRAEPLVALNSAAPPATGEDESADPASLEPTDAILRAQGMGWAQLIRVLLGMVAGYRARHLITFVLGVARVIALMGVGVLSALIVRAVKNGAPFGALLIALALDAPLAGGLHWLVACLAQ